MSIKVGNFSHRVAGMWYRPHVSSPTGASHNAAATGTFVWPVWNDSPYTINVTKIGVYSGGTSGDAGATDLLIQVGMYLNDGSGGNYPGTLVHDTGQMTVNTTGIQTSGTFSQDIAAGDLFWMVTRKNNTPSNAAASTACLYTAQRSDWNPNNTLTSAATINDADIKPLWVSTTSGALADPAVGTYTVYTSVANAAVPFYYINTVT